MFFGLKNNNGGGFLHLLQVLYAGINKDSLYLSQCKRFVLGSTQEQKTNYSFSKIQPQNTKLTTTIATLKPQTKQKQKNKIHIWPKPNHTYPKQQYFQLPPDLYPLMN